jgi:hypothetical protein
MSFPPRFSENLNKVVEAWNAAEEDIKAAEQIEKKVITPSINELRYAGRRLVEALQKIDDEVDHDRAAALLDDAWFDCLRARHDAIDSALMKMALDCEAAVKRLGPRAVVATFPNFSSLLRLLESANQKIRQSRRDRNNRDAIYETVSTVDFPRIIELFDEFRASESLMKHLATRDRRVVTISLGLGVLGVLFGIAGWLRDFF